MIKIYFEWRKTCDPLLERSRVIGGMQGEIQQEPALKNKTPRWSYFVRGAHGVVLASGQGYWKVDAQKSAEWVVKQILEGKDGR